MHLKVEKQGGGENGRRKRDGDDHYGNNSSSNTSHVVRPFRLRSGLALSFRAVYIVWTLSARSCGRDVLGLAKGFVPVSSSSSLLPLCERLVLLSIARPFLSMQVSLRFPASSSSRPLSPKRPPPTSPPYSFSPPLPHYVLLHYKDAKGDKGPLLSPPPPKARTYTQRKKCGAASVMCDNTRLDFTPFVFLSLSLKLCQNCTCSSIWLTFSVHMYKGRVCLLSSLYLSPITMRTWGDYLAAPPSCNNSASRALTPALSLSPAGFLGSGGRLILAFPPSFSLSIPLRALRQETESDPSCHKQARERERVRPRPRGAFQTDATREKDEEEGGGKEAGMEGETFPVPTLKCQHRDLP